MSEASVTSSADVASSSATSPQVAFEIGDTEADRTLDGTRSSRNQRLEESRLRHIAKSIGKLAVGLPETSAERFVFWAIAVILASSGLWVALRQTEISEWTAKKDYWEHCQDSQNTEEACEKAKTRPLEPPPVSLPWRRPEVRSLQQANTQPMDTFPGLALVFVGFPVIMVAWLPFRRRINRALRRPLRFTLAGSQPPSQQPRFLVIPEERIPTTALVLLPHSISTSTGIDSAHSFAELRVMDIPEVRNNPVYCKYRDLELKDICWSLKNRFEGSLKVPDNNGVAKYTGPRTVPQVNRYDVWSLGCLYLEFVTWLHLGWAGVELFRSKVRGKRVITSGRSRNKPRMIAL